MSLSTVFRRLPGLALVLAMLLATRSHAQTAPTWTSVQRTATAGTTGGSFGQSIAIAADGSQYVTGQFSGTLTLGSVTLMTGFGTGHLYVAKYSATGTALWATRVDTNNNSSYGKIAVDAAGNAYLTGYFSGFLAVGATTLTSTSGMDSYLIKFDAQGVAQWVRQGEAGPAGAAYASGVATDASGNVTIAGDFSTAVAFGGSTLSGAGVFMFRFSPTGTLLLSKLVSSAYGTAYDLALDSAGNAYITGGFEATTSFGTTALTSAGGLDIYVCKLDAAGNNVWAQRAGGPNEDLGQGVAVDATGSPVVSGYILSTPQVQSRQLYVARFTPQGSPLWTRQVASMGGSFSFANDVAYDGRGGCYVTGSLTGSAVFVGAATLAPISNSAYVVRYNGQGVAVWADQVTALTPTDFSNGYGVATDAGGNVFLTGQAFGNVRFGTLPTTGRSDIFVAKLTAGGILTATRSATSGLALQAYPNPASGSATVVLPTGGGQLELLDALGRTVRRQMLPATAGACPVSVVGLAPGLYQLRATLGNGQVANARLQVE